MDPLGHQLVRENFSEKVAYLARVVPAMTALDHGSFVDVDSGLPSDTFNVIVVRDLLKTNVLFKDGIGHFASKGFPMALWYWDDASAQHGMTKLIDYGMTRAETHVAMIADVAQTRVLAPIPDGLTIHLAGQAAELRAFGAILASLFGAADEGLHVATFFERVSAFSATPDPAMRHYIGHFGSVPVATGMLFVGQETLGIYDIATHESYRGRGIGSAMLAHLLNEAKSTTHEHVVLQASADGLGIYARAGFTPTGTVHTFSLTPS